MYGPNGLEPLLTAMPSRQPLALAAKQPTNGPPLDAGLTETIWVKNQCPPLAGSHRHDGSPPLLQCRFVSPISVSSEMTGDARFSALLKIRISPMLFVSTTEPLPAHSPWSGGSTSLNLAGIVVFAALSTALMPFTLAEPPANELMLSQPGRSGWQLTVGILTVGPLTCGTRGRINGIAAPPSDFVAAFRVWLAVRCAVDGVWNGPVSR